MMRQLNEIPAMSQDLREAYNILKAAIERGEVVPTPSPPKPDYSSMPLEELKQLQREQQQKELNDVVSYSSCSLGGALNLLGLIQNPSGKKGL